MSLAATHAWTLRDELYWSPALGRLGLVAGFTTKRWGSMAGSHHPPQEQAANRDALARHLGFDGVLRVKQVHGCQVAHVAGPVEPGGRGPRSAREASVPIADALWTDRPGVLLGIAAADCVPVLAADPHGPLGAAHAGWLGTSLGTAAALVEALVAGGAVRDRLVAAVGPSIGPCCYTIDAERAELVRSRIGEAALRPVMDDAGGGRFVFDLWAANVAALAAAGVRRVEVAGLCTRSGGADLWSYRARGDDGRYGTQLAFIGRHA